MSTETIQRQNVSDSMVLAVILIATVYWVLDSILSIFFSNRFNFIAELVGPNLYDVYVRAVVLCLFIIFGSHAQLIINKLRQAKEKLNESEELWRSLVGTAPDVITTVDRDGTIHFINHPFRSHLPEKSVGQRLYAFLPPAYRERARQKIERVFRTGETTSFEICFGDSRRPTWYTFRVGPLRLEDRVIAATIISTDTTEFKRAEELRRYKELFDNVAEGVFIFSLKGNFVESNHRLLESTGYTKAQILNMTMANLVEADQVPFVEEMMQQVRRDREVRFELGLKTRDGRLIPNEINCRFISYLGEPCFLCVARDITPTKLLQNQLIRSERLAATGQLAASIAHEINSPLQGITALLNVLQTTYGKDEYLLKKLDLIKSAFGSIRDTVRNLTDLNRPGKEQKQTISINQVIENTYALVRSHLTRSRVKLNLNLAPKLPAVTASPQQMSQVFMNLINNAVEAITGAPEFKKKLAQSPVSTGAITINTDRRKDQIVITIRDSGPGISEKDLEHIFDPFFTRKKTMGMGVGLSICSGIIEDHKGYIVADNAPDGGAIFTITLPLKGA